MENYLQHLECSKCGETYDPLVPQNVCTACGKPLLARYALEQVAETWKRDVLLSRPASLWRYRELLPISDPKNIVTLGETLTPLIHAKRLGARFGLTQVWVKDESRLPTGSFKARGLAMAVSKAKALGLTQLAIPSAGNAATALAVYAAAAGITAHIFMPQDTPAFNKETCQLAGANVTLIDGLITDAGKIVAERKAREGWFDVSTLKEPYRVEGKKTMGFELADQFGWELPDVIIYPTGGGTGHRRDVERLRGIRGDRLESGRKDHGSSLCNRQDVRRLLRRGKRGLLKRPRGTTRIPLRAVYGCHRRSAIFLFWRHFVKATVPRLLSQTMPSVNQCNCSLQPRDS